MVDVDVVFVPQTHSEKLAAMPTSEQFVTKSCHSTI